MMSSAAARWEERSSEMSAWDHAIPYRSRKRSILKSRESAWIILDDEYLSVAEMKLSARTLRGHISNGSALIDSVPPSAGPIIAAKGSVKMTWALQDVVAAFGLLLILLGLALPLFGAPREIAALVVLGAVTVGLALHYAQRHRPA